jgi:hypothetical protein
MDREQYENKLAALGATKVGGGLFANVFAIPGTDKVIKVARYDNWPTYIKWATQNGHAGKFAPKVYSLKFYDDFYVAVMERLVATIGQIKDSAGASSQQVADYRNTVSWNGEDKSKAPAELMAYLQALRDAHLADDLHDGNVMVRHDGQVVFTDPSSDQLQSNRFRIKSGTLR